MRKNHIFYRFQPVSGFWLIYAWYTLVYLRKSPDDFIHLRMATRRPPLPLNFYRISTRPAVIQKMWTLIEVRGHFPPKNVKLHPGSWGVIQKNVDFDWGPRSFPYRSGVIHPKKCGISSRSGVMHAKKMLNFIQVPGSSKKCLISSRSRGHPKNGQFHQGPGVTKKKTKTGKFKWL